MRLDDIKCPIPYTPLDFEQAVRTALMKTEEGRVLEARGDYSCLILKKSLDARKKPSLLDVYSVEVRVDEPDGASLPASLLHRMPEEPHKPGMDRMPPVVAGCGPAGLFAALYLATKGYRPILLERGKSVDSRVKDIRDFWKTGELNPESNVQFGEGGAGTFSDGKLTTGIKNPDCRVVLETFVEAGAPGEILSLAKPHIGTDLLRGIVKKIRERIEFLGGTVLFETKLDSIRILDGKICGVGASGKENGLSICTDSLILAIGHSARDTIRMLSAKGVEMAAKPFSMGVRIEHLQKRINESQYGKQPPEIEKILPAAEYKLSCHLPNGRAVYTFCMCPGGRVIGGSSDKGQVVTNGMSLHARDGTNANSAVLVNVDPSDFGSDSPLAGIAFQEQWEQKAFLAAGSNYNAPAQYVGDFLKRDSGRTERVVPTYTPGVAWTALETCLPSFVTDSIRLALPLFEKKLTGFADPGAVMTGIESRSSSPVRIMRDSRKMANIEGLYPCGEGAGYAGGIMSASVDGIACARAYTEQMRDNHA